MSDENTSSRIDGYESRVGCEVETTMSHVGSILAAAQAVCQQGPVGGAAEHVDQLSDLICVASRNVEDVHALIWPEADAG